MSAPAGLKAYYVFVGLDEEGYEVARTRRRYRNTAEALQAAEQWRLRHALHDVRVRLEDESKALISVLASSSRDP